jgi:5-hydroxyisourate hydrolase
MIIITIILTLLFVLLMANTSQISLLESDPYQLSTHVLDISKGKAAQGVEVHLHSFEKEDKMIKWNFLSSNITDSNGRISKTFLSRTQKHGPGVYKLTFFTGDYFKANKMDSFYPQIEVIFNITDQTHYHVPITLSNFGYSTYRGS